MNLNKIIENIGRYRKVIWNAAITNMLKESVAIAKSWTFGHGFIADMWEYKIKVNSESGLINDITIRNIYPNTHTKKSSAIWDMLEKGRDSYLIKTSHYMHLPLTNIYNGRFGVWTNLVFMPKKEGLHPLQRAKEHFLDRLKDFVVQIKASRWGNAEQKSKVDMVPNLYRPKSKSEAKYSKPLSKNLTYGSYLYKKDRPSERKPTSLLYKSYLKNKKR